MSASTRLMAISDWVTLDALRVGADLKGIAFISSQVVVTCRVSPPDELATIKREFEFMTEQLRRQSPQAAERRPMSRLARPPAGECSSKVRNRVIASSTESVPPSFCTASHACVPGQIAVTGEPVQVG
jgi:hypothetical protein